MTSVQIEWDKPRNLRLTLPSLRAVKKKTGLALGQLLVNVSQMDADAMVYFFWAAMRHEDRHLTPGQTELLLQRRIDQGETLEDFMELATEVMQVSGLLRTEDDAAGPEDGDDADEPESVPTNVPTAVESASGA